MTVAGAGVGGQALTGLWPWHISAELQEKGVETPIRKPRCQRELRVMRGLPRNGDQGEGLVSEAGEGWGIQQGPN